MSTPVSKTKSSHNSVGFLFYNPNEHPFGDGLTHTHSEKFNERHDRVRLSTTSLFRRRNYAPQSQTFTAGVLRPRKTQLLDKNRGGNHKTIVWGVGAERTAGCCFTSRATAFSSRPAIVWGCGGIIPPQGAERTAGCCFVSRTTACYPRPAKAWEREGVTPSQKPAMKRRNNSVGYNTPTESEGVTPSQSTTKSRCACGGGL